VKDIRESILCYEKKGSNIGGRTPRGGVKRSRHEEKNKQNGAGLEKRDPLKKINEEHFQTSEGEKKGGWQFPCLFFTVNGGKEGRR